jgi:YidC/Oxa1 family membrane protein insertase
MDNQRLLIWATFGMLAWMTYQAWVADYGPSATASQPTATQSEQSASDDGGVPALSLDTADTPPPVQQDQAPAIDGEPETTSGTPAPGIHVRTDVLDIDISTVGGTLTRASLLKYPVHKDQPDTLVELLSPGSVEYGAIRTGLNSAGEAQKADHNAIFASPRSEYILGNNDELVVPLSWQNEQGVRVEKTIRFTRGSYRIDIEQRLVNGSNEPWYGADYAQIRRRSRETERSMFDVDSYSSDGPVVYDGEKYQKLDRDDLLSDGPFAIKATDGWVGAIQHHFVSAVVPPVEAQYNYSVSISNGVSTASLIQTPTILVQPGAEQTFATTVFVGPKLQSQLDEIHEKLNLTVDYGWLTIISHPLFLLLSWVFSFVGNWGVAIILVTVMIKAVFYKLTEASGRSMAKMREIQPRMKALQDRYKDDRQALSQAMMELYKREKVNPAAGCLPILIQMPFFLAFYWMLLESVEMRQAPFALWLTDLSSRDPYFILPIIMGVAMLGQQRLNPTPGDPVQAKVMQVMPIIFTAFFAFFPSGLVLYWVTNTVLSIAQQWYINKIVHEEAAARKGIKKQKDKDKNKS